LKVNLDGAVTLQRRLNGGNRLLKVNLDGAVTLQRRLDGGNRLLKVNLDGAVTFMTFCLFPASPHFMISDEEHKENVEQKTLGQSRYKKSFPARSPTNEHEK
jgi:hypothetical protein